MMFANLWTLFLAVAAGAVAQTVHVEYLEWIGIVPLLV